MLLREYESKRFLISGRIPVPNGHLVHAPDELDWDSQHYPVAIKAQVPSGGRGKQGGVVRAEDAKDARQTVRRLLQSDFEGNRPDCVLVEPWLESQREVYLTVTIDPAANGYSVLYAPQGGVDVEAGAPPVRYPVGPPDAFRAYRLRALLEGVESDPALVERLLVLARELLRIAATEDCLMVEINPLIQTEQGGLIAADCKVVLDEAAAFRSAHIARQIEHQRLREEEAVRRCLEGRLMLVRLEGNVGLISGGAGMTMAVMDLIAEAGGRAACFLDCSANPTPDGYRLAFEMLDADPRVAVILVSIFGGATHMSRVGRTLRALMEERVASKPVVFRLAGTQEEGIAPIFAEAGLHNHTSLEEAVREAVRAAGGVA